MKLALEDAKTFQKAIGYVDDPCAMTVEDTAEEIKRWKSEIDELRKTVWQAYEQSDNSAVLLHEDMLEKISNFLGALGEPGAVECERPLEKYHFHAGIEYWKGIDVLAESQSEANELAKDAFAAVRLTLPQTIGGCDGVFAYLEQDDNEHRAWNRLIEE